MKISNVGSAIQVAADLYTLTTRPDRPYITIDRPDGERIVELFFCSSVHTLENRDDTPQTGNWQIEEVDGAVHLWIRAASSCWNSKTYRFICTPERLSYEIEVEGEGCLAEAVYFGGYYSANPRWGSGFFWSEQNFLRGFNPEPNSDECNYFQPAEGALIDLMGVPLPGKGNWFFTPPPFFYGFEQRSGWVGMGVESSPGGFQFTEYAYHGRKGVFYLSLSYEGYTRVKGAYRLPSIGFDFASGEFESLAAHTRAAHETLGTARISAPAQPAWWCEPIFCGWGAQSYMAAIECGHARDFSGQIIYNAFLKTLEESGIHPGSIVLDDKWQSTYGENAADPCKWPDLPGFIDKQHAASRKVLLWLKAWDPEGIPIEECITNAAGMAVSVDPSNPDYEQRMRRSVRQMLSSSGYDADGFKIDFTARIPSGPGMRRYGRLWGLELMKRYLWILYDEAKQVKPDALVMTHTPHPYLADVVDMIRLNDINKDKDVNLAMTLRARVASLACPEALIDTDNWPIPDKTAWRSYLALQPELGIPSLYYTGFIDSTREALNAEDYALIREVWSRHRAKI